MEEAVWWDPRDIRIALARLGLNPELLQEAVRAGYLGRISRTKNDSVIAPGLYQWNDTVRMLREQLVTVGWQRSDENGVPTVINPAKTIALCVSSGNENTGIATKTPGTKYQKGPCTAGFVASNLQIELFPLPTPARSEHDGSIISTWTLLFYTDEHEIRSEVSLAVFMDGGQIKGWKERILLPNIPLDGDDFRGTTEPDFGPDVDIEIRRLG